MGDSAGTAHLFQTHPTVLATIRSFVRGQASRAGLAEQTTDDVVQAVSEACANSLRHTVSPHIKLTWRLLPYAVEVDVEDGGVFRSGAVVPGAEGDSSGGAGRLLMAALTDEIVIRRGTEDHPGTLVRLVKYLPAPP